MYTRPKKYPRTTVRERVPIKLHLVLLTINLVLKIIPDSSLVIDNSCGGASYHKKFRGGKASTLEYCKNMSPVAIASTLAAVPDVDIDASGRFKYIQLNVYDPSNPDAHKTIVRGYSRHHFHMDILDEVEPSITKLGLKCECPGGGRLQHDPQAKTIKVFGYSTAFGQPDHSVSVEVLRKKYPDYDITWSNEGY